MRFTKTSRPTTSDRGGDHHRPAPGRCPERPRVVGLAQKMLLVFCNVVFQNVYVHIYYKTKSK
jgi:hypothetical protein